MYVLGIESSCDETSAAVVRMEEGRREILSNIVASQIEIHRLYGGVVPEIASRAHIEAVSRITYEAL
jgi:N6-L-threonylcarbamoyladenine synthase